MTRKPRGLRPDERDLWHRVAASAQPMHTDPARKAERSLDAKIKPKKPKADLHPFRVGAMAADPGPRHDLAPGIAERLAQAPLRMDRKAHKSMVRGKLAPEARIDLHGMTLAQAQPELTRFILNAHDAGRRLVLVITGKGKRAEDHGPIPQRMGVLRHQVPHWLSQPPLGPMVLQTAQAHLRHGGEGAYYVYLRRG